MFDFEKNEDGSKERYAADEAFWSTAPAGKIKHWGWWLLHNCVAHPVIGVLPIKASFDFHDWTSRKLHGDA